MFCTLKHTNLSDESYTFEATTPPFSRKREGRLAKIACTNCRISKLKCSGEPHSCQRCLTKKIECRYPSPPRGNSNRKPQTPPETPQTRPPSAPIDTTADDDFITVASNQETTYSSTLDDLDLGLGFEVSDFTTPESISRLLSDGEYLDPSDTMRPWQQQSFTFASDIKSPWNSTPEREDIAFSMGSKTSPTVSSQSASESSCSCFFQAVSTHEAIEVALWGQRELWSNADDILQYQKKALMECEGLLECRRCCAQSAYTMLLLSMCSKILGTLEDLCRGALWGGSDTFTTTEQGSDERKRKKSASDSDGGDESRRRGYGISIRNRQLDDDDEHLVLQSLLTARVARLGRLISTLEKLVSEHSWPAHKGLIREMQNRLAGGSFVVEKIRRPWTV
ncbi:hypothetical protein F5Y19DRAFT_207647 [Xylariaceae sp. FL1651]|nr:hypothetical protein F5Y19DRAFT_207647 [Xylariaceae sp. FL1651]